MRILVLFLFLALGACSTPSGSGWGLHPTASRFERTITAPGRSVPIAKMLAGEEPSLPSMVALKIQKWISGQQTDLAICRYDFTVTEDRRALKYVENGKVVVIKLHPQQSIRIHELEESCGFKRNGQHRGSYSQWRRM